MIEKIGFEEARNLVGGASQKNKSAHFQNVYNPATGGELSG